MNSALFGFINSTLKNPFFDWLMPLVSDKDYFLPPLALLLLGVAAVGGRRWRVMAVSALLGVAVANTVGENILKPWVGALRPYAELESVNLWRSGVWMVYSSDFYKYDPRQSFALPSSHAANCAALAAAFAMLSRRSLWAGVPICLLVGLSRVYCGHHYPGDVLAGFVWGGCCGVAAYYVVDAAAARLETLVRRARQRGEAHGKAGVTVSPGEVGAESKL